MKNTFLPSIVLSSLLAASVSCGGDGTIETSNAIHIIAVYPNTGAYAERGERYLRTTQMAAHDLEEAGELIPGRRILIHPIDSGDDLQIVEQRTETLVAELGAENVAAIMSATSTAHKGSLFVALDNGIPHFEWAIGTRDDEILGVDEGPTMEERRPLFQLRGLCPTEAEMTATAIYQKNYQKVGLLRGSQDHDKTHTNIIRADLESYATQSDQPWTGKIVNTEDFEMQYDNEVSWQEYIDQFMTMYPDTDALFYHLDGDTVNFSFLKAAKARFEAGGTVPVILTCDMARKPALLDPVATNVADYLVGRFFFVGRGPLESELGNNFVTDLKNRYNVDADRWSKTGYDAMVLTGLAIASTQSTEHTAVTNAIYAHSKIGQAVSAADVSAALSAARSGVDIDYTGVSGNVDIREATDPSVPTHLDRTVEAEYYVEDIVSDGNGGFIYRTVEEIPGKVL